MNNLVESLRPVAADIYGIREDIGAAKAIVYMYYRNWAERVGVGAFNEEIHKIVPVPRIVTLSIRRDVDKHGQEENAFLLLHGVVIENYPTVDLIDNTAAENSEKFYLIQNKLYTVVDVERKHLTWNVEIKRSQKAAPMDISQIPERSIL